MKATASVETQVGDIGVFKVVTYVTVVDELEHVAFVKEPSPDEPVLGRVQQKPSCPMCSVAALRMGETNFSAPSPR